MDSLRTPLRIENLQAVPRRFDESEHLMLSVITFVGV